MFSDICKASIFYKPNNLVGTPCLPNCPHLTDQGSGCGLIENDKRDMFLKKEAKKRRAAIQKLIAERKQDESMR
jgi:hypothetical protein